VRFTNANSYSDGTFSDSDLYGYGDCDGAFSNSDRYGDGNGNGNRDAHAAAYPDAETGSDADAAPDSDAIALAAADATLIRTIQAGTREQNSRVPRLRRVSFTERSRVAGDRRALRISGTVGATPTATVTSIGTHTPTPGPSARFDPTPRPPSNGSAASNTVAPFGSKPRPSGASTPVRMIQS